ncbi:MAG TPA: ATP-binding cassette domain-containing protein [Caulobacteraceae bacterium]|nr:ATP-binding cassette domain-containing protein [Caulobacteraceae bacterium]
MSGAALALDGVTKRYGAFTAVDGLSFRVEPGRILGFLGPNGAGKTSTIRMILGLIAPTAGAISVLGASDIRSVRDRIGFLPEERGLYRRMTPVAAIAFLASLKGVAVPEAKRRARQMLEAQGLGDAAGRQIRMLSKGMAQKVQLLSAIAHEPDLVLLDEPFSGLDPVNQQSLETLIRELAARGATVVFSTHVMQHAERLCDQVVLLANGKKVFDGAVEAARAAAPRTLVIEGGFDPARLAAVPGLGERTVEPADDGGVRVTAVLERGAPAQAALTAAFNLGLDIRRFELREPHLHDAFIVLTAGAGQP